MLVAHGDGHLHQADAVEILHVHRVGMVPVLRIIAAHEEEVGKAERGRAEQVGLQCDAVAIASGDLDDGLDAGLADQQGGRDRGHRGDAAIAIRDVHGVDAPLEHAGATLHDLAGRALGRVELGGHDELALPEKRCQVAQQKRPLPIQEKSPLRVDPLSSFPVRQGRSWHRSGPPLVAEASSGRSLSLFWMKKGSRL